MNSKEAPHEYKNQRGNINGKEGDVVPYWPISQYIKENISVCFLNTSCFIGTKYKKYFIKNNKRVEWVISV